MYLDNHSGNGSIPSIGRLAFSKTSTALGLTKPQKNRYQSFRTVKVTLITLIYIYLHMSLCYGNNRHDNISPAQLIACKLDLHFCPNLPIIIISMCTDK